MIAVTLLLARKFASQVQGNCYIYLKYLLPTSRRPRNFSRRHGVRDVAPARPARASVGWRRAYFLLLRFSFLGVGARDSVYLVLCVWTYFGLGVTSVGRTPVTGVGLVLELGLVGGTSPCSYVVLAPVVIAVYTFEK